MEMKHGRVQFIRKGPQLTPTNGALVVTTDISSFFQCLHGARLAEDGRIEVFIAKEDADLVSPHRQPLIMRLQIDSR